MKAWKQLALVETIHEEKESGSSSTSPSLSSTPSSPPTPLHAKVQAWSQTKGQKPDVLVRVHGRRFLLHKDAMTSRSAYLRREIADVSEFTLSPPLKITPETFSLVADFCYGTHIVVTPFNVAALRTAAELLGMTEPTRRGEENLLQIAETHFRRIIAVNLEYTSIVFRSCLSLLPEAESTACLVSRCVEALSSAEDDGGGHSVACFYDVKPMSPEDFQIVAESMHRRLTNHDVLYRTVDLYFKGCKGKLTEDQRTQICNSIDCNKLSPQLLLEAVQNPAMPLRFMVRAMLMEQLNTRRSMLSATANQPCRQWINSKDDNPATLGAILQRETAVRQAVRLKTAMDATSSRIESLEKELTAMKKLLQESETQSSIVKSARSASFHYGAENKIARGERGSASSASLQFGVRGERAAGSSSLEGLCSRPETPAVRKNMRQKFIDGLKSVFRVSKSASKNGFERKKSGTRDEDHYADIICKPRELTFT